MSTLGYLNWAFLIFCFSLHQTSCDPRITEAGLICGNSMVDAEPSSNLIPKFLTVMRDISSALTSEDWGNSSVTTPLPQVYGLAQCHADLNQEDCLVCFATGRPRIPSCLPNTGRWGRLYLDGCFIRYDFYNFYNETLDPKNDNFTCSAPSGVVLSDQNVRTAFGDRVDQVLTNLTATAIKNNGFAVAEETRKGLSVGVYALGQCWSTIDANGCRECLENATMKLKSCVPGDEGRAMNAGCYLRYSTHKFYSISLNKGSTYSAGVIVAIALSGAAALSLILCGAYIGYKRISEKREIRRSLERAPAFLRRSKLHFKYEILEKATDFFHESQKLGQGGAGSVYKGNLPDGRVVAVKRLVFNTRQWVDDFFNEVNLINGIQHKNLVRLLGCSIEGPESLLVYEFVPNRSLDQVLFDPNTMHILSWHERLHVISGTAEGLAYLHEGCAVKIIHRDIKSSNILLDGNFNAKIADFGLARCVDPDKSHISTGIAGTMGYMAPEYLVKGQLTEKADVYSFGVLILEILSGRKNSTYSQGSGYILQSVWKHYNSNSLTECMDPALEGNFPSKEASNMLQIGLLCTQAFAELRPSMSQVLEMINNRCSIVPSPKQPPFLNASVLSPNNSTSMSSHTNTSISNQLTKSEASSTFPEQSPITSCS